MNTKGYSGIPRELGYWITFLSKALPLRSVGTFIELLFGAMLTPMGFVTEAYLALPMRNHWSSYYKWLQKGKWSWLGLARQFVRLMLKVVKPDVIHLAIDDTLTLRASKKAPGSQMHHQHGNKPNLAAYVRGQCWVSLAWVVRSGQQAVALPLLSRLVPAAGNTGKRVAAQVLIRGIYRLLEGHRVRVLVDSWYMKGVFIESMLRRGFAVIGQVRIDTRLYNEPPRRRKGQRGRPRKYGRKYTPERIAHLKRTVVTLPLYGKEQTVRYRSKVLLARFLNGHKVRVVWCEFQRDEGQWTKARLLLSTDVSLTPEQMIESYAERWSIEPMFHQLKQAWGLKEAWQQSRQTLHRWVHLTQVGYGLLQLLRLLDSEQVAQLCRYSPWRKDNPVTAGQIRRGVVMIFRHVPVRQWWNRKCKKFEPPDGWETEENDGNYANSGF
ncbi:IS701 family transposase [methane-oxidizing endosymbiont of Gigantopelta aegis]|uniref:IS701 family transposase n=1 Tax=methane-oxidizing endosymbiont of Gigantopelta aegis TaxID=2794938 RepID=UPI003CC9C51C